MKNKIWYIVIGVAVIAGGIFGWRYFSTKKTAVTYETEIAEKGTLTTSVSSSGTIISSNTYDISTSVTGTIIKIYVKNGDEVTEGEKIAEIEMDDTAKQEKTTLYSSYLSAQNGVESAKQDKLSLSAQIDQNKASVAEAQNNVDYANSHDNPSTKTSYTTNEKDALNSKLAQAQKTLQLSEQKYSQSDTAITLAETKLASAYLEYENYSTTIAAPAAGKIISLSYEEGDTISSGQSTSSNTSSTSGSTSVSSNSSSATIGTIVKESNKKLQAEVTIAEADIVKVKQDQKVTITIDALSSETTYTGKVLSIDTTGQVSSGVTTYSAIVEFDDNIEDAYSNMNITANITTNIINDVILVSSSAITTANNVSTVQILKDGAPQIVTVEVGEVNDTQTVIKSGLSVGDAVITKTNSTNTTTSKATTTGSSIFGQSSNNRSGAQSGGMPAGGPGGM